jgi:hypothetical protein
MEIVSGDRKLCSKTSRNLVDQEVHPFTTITVQPTSSDHPCHPLTVDNNIGRKRVDSKQLSSHLMQESTLVNRKFTENLLLYRCHKKGLASPHAFGI